jgi:hypothetical protein
MRQFNLFLHVCAHSSAKGQNRCFRGAYCLHHPGPDPVNFGVATRRYIPEDSTLHTRLHENLKSHMVLVLLETIFKLESSKHSDFMVTVIKYLMRIMMVGKVGETFMVFK